MSIMPYIPIFFVILFFILVAIGIYILIKHINKKK